MTSTHDRPILQNLTHTTRSRIAWAQVGLRITSGSSTVVPGGVTGDFGTPRAGWPQARGSVASISRNCFQIEGVLKVAGPSRYSSNAALGSGINVGGSAQPGKR
ncbi:hypothetical protein CN244_27765 [Sinorhizobium medicae]|nr:hypothetical protein CN178_18825 [Sinorhizobium medicae]RVQ60579.1 hypothetical protein CN244_27765 [Sinorhizobium medicae]